MLCAVVGLPVASQGQGYLPEPENPAYYTYVAVAGEDIELDQNVQATGDLHANEEVELEQGVLVTGDVSAVDGVDNSGTVTGTIDEDAEPVVLPALPTEAEARTLADRIFEEDMDFDLDEVIDDIVFVNGDVRFEAALNGTGAVIAMGDIRLKEGSAGQLLPGTSLSLVAHGDIRLDDEREFRGALVAAEDIELKEGSSFEGVAIAGGELDVDEDSSLTFIQLDEQAPAIDDLQPPDGAVVTTATPSVSANWSDAVSGVDPATFSFLVDGVQRAFEASATTSGFSWMSASALSDGSHSISATVADHAGNEGTVAWSFSVSTAPVDTDPPFVGILPFSSPHIVDSPILTVRVVLDDVDSGIDTASLLALLDGVDISASCVVDQTSASCPTSALASGTHQADVTVGDVAGNTTSASLSFDLLVDQEPPVLTIVSPVEGAYLDSGTFAVSGSAVDDVEVAQVLVNGEVVALNGGSFSATVVGGEGPMGIAAEASDVVGRSTTALLTVTVDLTAPSLAVVKPLDGALVNTASIAVSGTAADAGGLGSLQLNGATIPIVDEAFDTSFSLAEGINTLNFELTDLAGRQTQATLSVTRSSVPTVAVTDPAEGQVVTGATVAVSGVVSGAAVVSVNGVAAAVNAGTFVASGVAVFPGGNSLEAIAVGPTGTTVADGVHVIVDVDPPRLSITTPEDGGVVFVDSITVAGLANDVVGGTVNSPQLTVTVNGLVAEVDNRSFRAREVPLGLGSNVIEVMATDQSGNAASTSISVERQVASAPTVRLISGDAQSGEVSTVLAAPLVVEVVDALGLPLSGVPVVFSPVLNSGLINGASRQAALSTGGDGRVSAFFTLGSDSGTQFVQAQVPSVGGRVTFVLEAVAGSPVRLVPDGPEELTGLTEHPASSPLITVVVDGSFNRVAGVPVTFEVIEGGGELDNGQSLFTTITDADGRAVSRLTLGPEPGVSNNVVQAYFDAILGPRLSFAATARVAGDAADTSVSGIVLDNSNVPVPGVTVTLAGTALSTPTAADGTFRLEGAPVGVVHLEVDGSTTTRPGTWASLMFTLDALPGNDNTIGGPIYLLPLSETGLFVSETTGGTLTLPELPGFSLFIEPGSVTFPDGTNAGLVSVTQVHYDKVPMVPRLGLEPNIVVTIQPAGAKFDPPAPISFPNTDCQTPGTQVDLFSFDHDLEQFVSIGPGTISEDGLTVASNPGVGVVKAGWHDPGDDDDDDDDPSCAHDCNDCELCKWGACQVDPAPGPLDQGPNPDKDCVRFVCSEGDVTQEEAPGETPEQEEGNCKTESCDPDLDGEMDLSDFTVPKLCCGDPALPEGPFNPVSYNPETQCCNPGFGLPPKRPVPPTPFLEQTCPDRTQNEEWETEYDGCSIPGVLELVIALGVGVCTGDIFDNPFCYSGDVNNPAGGLDTHFSLASEEGACDFHDNCYQTCTTDSGHDECDDGLQDVGDATCFASTEGQAVTQRCFFWSGVYADFLHRVGGFAFNQRQQDSCQCCP